jgi:hypothetical protein
VVVRHEMLGFGFVRPHLPGIARCGWHGDRRSAPIQ